jgi:hypothetical protein
LLIVYFTDGESSGSKHDEEGDKTGVKIVVKRERDENADPLEHEVRFEWTIF